jgi:hypothetical protein
MAPRLVEHSVIFDEEVLEWITARFQRTYPLESGAFLFGEYWDGSRHKIPYITQASEPRHTINTADEWNFDHAEVLNQTRLAAADGRMLMGWAHSHPWEGPFIGMNHQSITDARTQIEYRFTISLVIGVWKTGWWFTAWKEGFAAPLFVIVRTKKGQLITSRKWYYSRWKTRPWYFQKQLDKYK